MDIKVLYDEETIKKRVKELGEKITLDYGDDDIVFISILKGAVSFSTDLAREIKSNNLIMDYMRVSSYGNKKESDGNVTFSLDISTDITNKNVIIVEDIIDSGYTLEFLKKCLALRNPKSIKICVLLDKKARRKVDIDVDYVGFEIDDKFVLGYGLDYEQKYRNLPYIGYVEK